MGVRFQRIELEPRCEFRTWTLTFFKNMKSSDLAPPLGARNRLKSLERGRSTAGGVKGGREREGERERGKRRTLRTDSGVRRGR